MTSRPIIAAAVLWGLAGLTYLAAETIAAHAFPGYSYSHDYISLLGEPRFEHVRGQMIGSPLSGVMNLGFIGEGVLYITASCFASVALKGRRRGILITLAVVHGGGNLLVGIFHAGQAANGSFPLHLIGAIMAIAGGNLVSIYFGTAACKLNPSGATRTTSILLGFFGLACLLILGVNIRFGAVVFPDAVWERGSVYAITAWELFISATLLRRLR